jgi:hypothetical protein
MRERETECVLYDSLVLVSFLFRSHTSIHLIHSFYPTQVGAIDINPDDPQGCSFSIQVLGRDYNLRADSRAACRDWVITLNRVKEAKLEQGNVKLVVATTTTTTTAVNPFDVFAATATKKDGANTTTTNAAAESNVTPRIVVVANRGRTKAVDEEEQWDDMMMNNNNNNTTATGSNTNNNPISSGTGDATTATVGAVDLSRRRSTIQNVVLARWSKQSSSVSRLAAKLARWARSLQKYSCAAMTTDAVQLDRHVHPPGHDDAYSKRLRNSNKSKHHHHVFGDDNGPASGGSGNQAGANHVSNKPIIINRNMRAFSTASEDDARMIA